MYAYACVCQKKKLKVKNKITNLKHENLILINEIENNIIMSEVEKYQLKEVIEKQGDELNSFKDEVREGFLKISDKIEGVAKEFTNYVISNNTRISKLEGVTRATNAKIAVYVAIGSTFLMGAVQLYMSLKG